MNRNEIVQLIPHAGAMCLLDEVIAWDANSIDCRSRTHLNDTHPLRHRGRLAIVHLIEYAAQTVAVHGGLLARDHGESPLTAGRLAGLRDVEFNRDDITAIDGALEIHADRELAGTAGLIYRVTVRGDQLVLARGQLTIIGSAPEAIINPA